MATTTITTTSVLPSSNSNTSIPIRSHPSSTTTTTSRPKPYPFKLSSLPPTLTPQILTKRSTRFKISYGRDNIFTDAVLLPPQNTQPDSEYAEWGIQPDFIPSHKKGEEGIFFDNYNGKEGEGQGVGWCEMDAKMWVYKGEFGRVLGVVELGKAFQG